MKFQFVLMVLLGHFSNATLTNPGESKSIQNGSPRYSYKLTQRGYSLSKVTMYKSTEEAKAEWKLQGIKLEWSPDSGVGEPVSLLYGIDTVDSGWAPKVTHITKRVVAIELYGKDFGDSKEMHGFRFHHPDGTKTATPRYDIEQNPIFVHFYRFNGNFIGLDVVIKDLNRVEYRHIAYWDDIGGNPCSPPESISFLQMGDINFFLNQNRISLTYALNSYNNWCYSATYSLQYKTGLNQAVSTPFSFLSVDESATQFEISTSSPNDIGTYQLIVSATLSDTSYSMNATCIRQINIKNDCENTTIICQDIPDITAEIKALPSDPSFHSQALIPSNTIDAQSTGYCGAYVYSLNPVLSFVRVNGQSLEVDLTDLSYAGTHDLSLTISLHTSASTLVKNFRVNLQCKVKSIVFTSQPLPSYNFALGFDVSPLILQFRVQKLPNCQSQASSNLSFNLVEASPLTTTIKPTQNGASLNFELITNSIGVFQLKMRATQDQASADADFQLKVFKPCSTASILPSPDSVVSDFKVILPLATRAYSQAFFIKLNLPEIYSSISCSFKTELNVGATDIMIIQEESKIIFTYALGADLGTFISNEQRQLTVTLDDDPSITSSFAFSVQISVCQITEFKLSEASTGLAYDLDSMTVRNIPFSTSIMPADCLISTVSYTVFDKSDLGTAPIEVFANNLGVSIDSDDYQLIGVREYIYSATLASTSYMNQKQATVQFSITFYPGACAQATVLVPSNAFLKTIRYTTRDLPTIQMFQPFPDSVQEAKGFVGVCGQKSYLIVEDYNFVKVLAPSQGMELTDNWGLEVYTNNIGQVGVYQASLVASLIDYPLSTPAIYSFQIEVLHPCIRTQIESQAINNMEYIVGDSSAIQTFSQFSDSISRELADSKICGQREYKLVGAPSCVKLSVPVNQWDAQSFIEVQTFNKADAGTYIIILQARLVDYNSIAEASKTFKVVIQGPLANKKPYFVSSLELPLTIKMTSIAESWSYTFPQIKDDDKSGELTMQVDLGDAQSFVELVQNQIKVKNISDTTKVRPGSYFIKVTISDTIEKVDFQVMLLVFGPIEEKTPIASCSAKFVQPENQTVTYESASTPLMVSWSRFQVETDCEKSEVSLSLKSVWSDDRFTQDSDWFSFSKTSLDNSKEKSFFMIASNEIYGDPFKAVVCVEATLGEVKSQMNVEVTIIPRSVKNQAGALVLPPQMKIDKFDVTGQLTLSFNQKVVVYDDLSDIFMSQPLKFLRVTASKNPKNRYYDQQKYIDSGAVLSAKVVSFKEYEIKLQIQLSNPLYVSYDPLYPDTLTVDVVDPSYFVSSTDLQTTVLKGTRLQIQIESPLAPTNAIQTLKNVNSNAERVNILATSSLPINLVIGVSLKYLWGMINPLQFVVYMKEWKINWPANARLIVETLETIALGKFIKTDRIKRKFMDFYGIKVNFNNGVRSRELTQKKQIYKKRVVGSAVGLAAAMCVAIICLGLFLRTKYADKLVQMAQNVKKKLFWNFFIRSFLQSFLSQSLLIIGFFVPERTIITSKNKKAQIYTATIVMLVLIPAIFIYLIHRYFSRLKEEYLTERYGSLYLGVRTDSRWSAFHVIAFLIIRLGFALISFMLRPWPGVLIFIYMVLNMMYIIYLGWVRPFDAISQQGSELFNACMLQLIAYIMLCLTNLMSGPESEFTLGWVLIGAIAFMFIGNLALIFALNLQKICRLARLHYLRHQKKKQQKNTDEQLVEAVFKQTAQKQADSSQLAPQPDRALLEVGRVSTGFILVPDMSVEYTDRNLSNQDQLLIRPDPSSQYPEQLDKISRFANKTASQIMNESQMGDRQKSESYADFYLPEPELSMETVQAKSRQMRCKTATANHIFAQNHNLSPKSGQLQETTPKFGLDVVADLSPSLPDQSVQNSFSGATKKIVKQIKGKVIRKFMQRKTFAKQ